MAIPARNEFAEMIEVVASARVEQARAAMQAGVVERERHLATYLSLVESSATDIIGLMKVGHDVDPESMIDAFEEVERKTVAAIQDLRNQVAGALKTYKKSRPEALPLLNDLLALGVKQLSAEARVHRDMRWRLMAARAEFQPSPPVGQINGTGEPVN